MSSISNKVSNIIIVVLLSLVVYFGYKWYFSFDNKEYKNQLEQLKKDNENLINTRDSLKVSIINLEKEYDIISKSDSLLKVEVDNLSLDIEKSKERASYSYDKLVKVREDLLKSRERINQLMKNPPIKSDSLLIESLKNKLNNQ